MSEHVLYDHFQGLGELVALMGRMDAATRDFGRLSGLSCINGCGECCHASARDIECSVFEALPLAIALWDMGQGERWYEIASVASGSDTAVCVMYSQEKLLKSGGACRHYQHRPVLCRMFGFSAIADKKRGQRLSICRRISSANPAQAYAVREFVASGVEAPSITNFASEARFLNPSLSYPLYGINTALALALEAVMFRAGMMGLRPRHAADPSAESAF